jgi:hypothetical protein
MDVIQSGFSKELEDFLMFRNITFTSQVIDKILDISTFVLKFFKEEKENSEGVVKDDEEDVMDSVERLLLMNLNQNFQLSKADFQSPLNLIFDYLRLSKSTKVL